MKGSSRLDVVSAGGLGMEESILKSLRDRHEENTNSIVKKLGEGWTSTSDGASCGHRGNDVGVIVSVYNKNRDKFGYKIKVETVNVGSGKNLVTPQECKTSLIEELKDISYTCTELANLLANPQVNSVENESDSQETSDSQELDDSAADK